MPQTRVVHERTYDAPPELVWALLGDSNRFDRAMRLGLPSYSWREIDGKRQHVAHANYDGLMVEWIEPPYQWIEARLLDGVRTFTKGPLGSGGMRVELFPEGKGTRARATVWGDSPHWYMWFAKPIMTSRLRNRSAAFLDAVDEVLRSGPLPGDPDAPPIVRIQPLLAGMAGVGARGQVTKPDIIELDRRARRLRDVGLRGDAVERIIELLRDHPDEDVSQIQPFARARAWGLDRREVLRTFLHATRAGLVDLNWQINCPVCRVSAAVATTMEQLGKQVHCDACNIRYDVDFATSVEAVFRCNPAVRNVEPSVFCAASPALRPHVLAQLALGARETRETTMPLRDGGLIVRTLGRQRADERRDRTVPAEVRVTVHDDHVRVEGSGTADGNDTKLVLVSEVDEPTHVLIERGTWSGDAVLGAAIASFPEFVELFATEAPAAGLDLSIGRMGFLFSDLTGSTALYERVGDARAYAIVQDHFKMMESIIGDHEGAVVKTMGDAVMAAFARADLAVAAAIAVADAAVAEQREHGIGVKLGVHEGACLGVRANDRLDFFGTTVNLAARLQAQAKSGELVITRELAESPRVAALLQSKRTVRRFRAALKGIAVEQDLVGVELTAPRTAAQPDRASGE